MTTSGTKTRALCVATRCTSIDQFVATFHRFCGDDQTFFVATMTSRPIGLETAFSIQLADKQPVLRGLCIVLDAWATPENRYKRPGIRLGIKRLTAESQHVFDRLRAASRSPALLETAAVIAEATPPHGTAPVPSLAGTTRPPPLAGTTRPPLPPLVGTTRPPSLTPRSPGTPLPSRSPGTPLPSLVPLRTGLPSVRALPPVPLAPISVEPKPTAAVEPQPLPPPPKPPGLVAARPFASLPVSASVGKPAPVVAQPALIVAQPAPVVAQPELIVAQPAPVVAQPALVVAQLAPVVAQPAPVVARSAPVVAKPPSVRPTPRPVEVTRFQVALNVDAAPPPVHDVEFKPTQLISRARAEPRIISEPAPDEPPIDPGGPAMIIDRPSGPAPRDTLRGFAPVPAATRGSEPVRAVEPPTAEPAVDQRTPGSTFILPANPLQHLSDESLEGFVDCTIYEETGNFFQPEIDAPDWNDELADPPAAPIATRAPTVPAMPFDAAPNLMVRTFGDTESLRVAPDDPPPATAAVSAIDRPTEPLLPMVGYAVPLPIATGALQVVPDEPARPVAWFDGVSGQVDGSLRPPLATEYAYSPDHPYGVQGYNPHLVPLHSNSYPTIDPALYTRPEALPALPPVERRARPRPSSPRWAVIAGTAAAAILVAIVLARMVRGAGHDAATTATASHATPVNAITRSPSVVHVVPRAGSAAPASRDPRPQPVVPAGEALAAEDDGEAIAGGAPVVGSGPCKLTVSTTPAGSIVRLDDQPVGPSPITIESTCDKHKIDVAHARYQGSTRWVTLVADKPQDVDISLPRPVHAVTVTSLPPGAELSIDGHRAGTTPTIVQMMGFASVNLTFTKAGFHAVTKKVYSKLPQDRVFVRLEK